MMMDNKQFYYNNLADAEVPPSSSFFTCTLCDIGSYCSFSSTPNEPWSQYYATPTKSEIMKNEYNKVLRMRAKKLTKLKPDNPINNGCWTDKDISLLLNEIEIEIGEKMNRFLYEDERQPYCSYLADSIPFRYPKTADQIGDMILWLWLTWEAISKATGQSWWNVTEKEKHRLSLFPYDKDQKLKSKFKYFDACDRVFAYISQDEGEDDEEYLQYYNDTIYY